MFYGFGFSEIFIILYNDPAANNDSGKRYHIVLSGFLNID
ncbi:hypothetical Protein YC6258_02996 [Gynuella sunshinyii YC6258]|uniref:Uncharacterized protein n=1 Tax=Gynuella sunshinyii YC6258 TaxID=1445510 RepID=A0A0C5VX69_9GAMM|nr:hypothetical Protein YC6258_02996 [Gynuella sunshinyii YC6258]